MMEPVAVGLELELGSETLLLPERVEGYSLDTVEDRCRREEEGS
jgi:hypothetical protein